MSVLYVQNESAALKDPGYIAAVVDAVQTQIADHVFPAWGIGISLHFDRDGEQLPPGSDVLTLVDRETDPEALGHHQWNGTSASGLVGVQTALDDGVAWERVFSHEVGEDAIDRFCRYSILVGTRCCDVEPFDPPEESDPDYKIDGIPVSNFVLPAWYDLNSHGPWDYRGKLSGPLTVSPGGYYQYWENGQWNQEAGHSCRASKRKVATWSRRGRRLIRAGVLP